MNIKSTTYLTDGVAHMHLLPYQNNQSPTTRQCHCSGQISHCSPSNFDSSVSVTDLRIVDRGFFALTGDCGRYADVICNPQALLVCPRCHSTVLARSKVSSSKKIKNLQPASYSCSLHPCPGLGRLETFKALYLPAVMARCWLAKNGLCKSPLLLKPRVYYGELSPAWLGISNYIGAMCCISG